MSVIERLLGRDGNGSADLVVEPMRKRDVRHGVMPIETVSYPRPWSYGVFEAELAQVRSGDRFYLVARDGTIQGRRRSVVGYAGLWFTPDEAHVTNVAVHPDHQRRGVATRLLVALADEVRRRGRPAWTLEVRASSLGAQALYRRFGFAPAGVRARYYEHTEDAIVMWCSDVQDEAYGALLERMRAEVTG